MKNDEKAFFLHCINECKIHWGDKFVYKDWEKTPRDIINEIPQIPYKRMIYYLRKWNDKQIYDYGVCLDLGWFELKGIINNKEYLKLFSEIYLDKAPSYIETSDGKTYPSF